MAAYLANGHDVLDFTRIGTAFIDQGAGRSPEVHLDPGYHPPANQTARLAYDGEFSYYIALDPSRPR